MQLRHLLAVLACLPAFASAQSFNFRSIGDAPAILYDAPTQNGIKRYVAPRGMPVEVVHEAGNWVKVRDVTGEMNWVEKSALGAKRTVVVTAASAKIRAKTESNASVVFSADKGVLLEMVEPPAFGWIKVQHRDGQSGYVHVSEVWGA